VDVLNALALGFSVALSPPNLLACAFGVLIGTLVGVLPGIGAAAGIALLTALTAGLDATTALIMLAGIYYGAMYGGSTSAILLNMPGEAASVMTAVDGYRLALQGRAGPALGMAAIASFVAGTLSLCGLVLLAPPLADLALAFGPSESFALTVLGLSVAVSLAGRSLLRGLAATLLGLLLGMVGLDPQTGVPRFVFGTSQLLAGFEVVSILVGLYAVAEVLASAEQQPKRLPVGRLTELFPSAEDWRRSAGALGRSPFVGFCLGLLPGGSPAIASFLAYTVEKRLSRHPARFGSGAIEGVAAAEGANNAATSGGFVPLFTLGIPTTASLAMLLGALMIHGLRPGPLLFQSRPDVVWGLIASMYIGNLLLLVLNLPLVGIWASLTRIPYAVLAPLILALSFVGTYSIRNSLFDVWVMVAFGLIGYAFQKRDYPTVPLVLALILGPTLESTLRQALALSRGDPTIFLVRPISASLLLLALVSVGLALYERWRSARAD
jgi:putative tricarboxylic transport membrane protein